MKLLQSPGTTLVVSCMLILTASCNPGSENRSRTVTSEDVKEEIEQAADTARVFVNQEKALLVNVYEERLELVEQQIGNMRDRMSTFSVTAKESYQTRIAKLENQLKSVQTNLNELQDASTDAWEELKEGVDEAVKELEESVSQAKDELEEQ